MTTLSRRQFLHASAGTLAAGALMGCATNPVTGKSELLLLSPAQEVNIDRENAPHQFSADYGAVQDKALASYIAGVGTTMVPITHRPEMPYSFTCVNATYVNAYAFPGGTVGITRGILLKMENEAELGALIGHELGHVASRHTAQRMSRSMLANIAVASISIAIKDASTRELVGGLGAIGAGVLLASYSRDQEREADALGLEYSTRSGYSPEGFIDLMSMLNDLSGSADHSQVDLLFSTHPMSRERYDTAVAEVRTGRYDRTRPIHRERYMDNIKSLRTMAPAIEAMQQGDREMAAKKLDAAREQYARAVKLAPKDYTARMLLAKCYHAQKNSTEATVQAKHAIGLYPNEPQGHHLLGFIAMNNKQYEQALDNFTTYEKLLPGNPNTIFFQGYSYEGMSRRTEAAQKYRDYLQKGGSGEYGQHAQNRLAQWRM